MTDRKQSLVERLRDCGHELMYCECKEAADEIERLREALQEIRKEVKYQSSGYAKRISDIVSRSLTQDKPDE